MEEKIDRIEKAVAQNTQSINDLIEIVVSIKDHMVTKDELASEVEKLTSKIDGVQRAVDAGFERQGSLETRVSKIEEEFHPV